MNVIVKAKPNECRQICESAHIQTFVQGHIIQSVYIPTWFIFPFMFFFLFFFYTHGVAKDIPTVTLRSMVYFLLTDYARVPD